MSSDIHSTKPELFTQLDEAQAMSVQPLPEEQLEQIPLSIPICYSLLEALYNFERSQGSVPRVQAILDSIVKSESFFFQESPVMYEPTGGFLSLVPDDGHVYNINWKAFILQAHISFLIAQGWDSISANRKKGFSRSDSSELQQPMQTPQSLIGSRAGTSIGIGSLARRQQLGPVGSFAQRSAIAAPSNIGSLTLTEVPKLERDEAAQAQPENLPADYDPQHMFSIQIQCGMQSPVFRAIIAAILARGLLDVAFAYTLVNNYAKEIEDADIKPATQNDSTSAFDNFYQTLNASMNIDEAQIYEFVAKDKINAIFDAFQNVDPLVCTPHARNFIESIIAPLCYHETPSSARRAAALYTNFLNYHNWDPSVTKVVTYKTPIFLPQQGDSKLLIAAPTKNGKQFFLRQTGKYTPNTTGFFDVAYARILPSGEYEVDKNVQVVRYVVLPSTARQEVIHELPAFDHNGPIRFDALEAQLEDLADNGVTAVHVPGAIATTKPYLLTHVTDHSVISKECGGIELFKQFAEHARNLKLRVLLDFEPLVSVLMSSRKYSMYNTVHIDEFGRLVTVVCPKTEVTLLNVRSTKLWELFAKEISTLAEIPGVSGFFLGDVSHWDQVYGRDLQELTKIDPDDEPHYNRFNILQGTVVDIKSENCGLITRKAKRSPFLMKIMSMIWAEHPDTFVWMQCQPQQEAFCLESGVIPQCSEFADLIINEINNASHTEDFHYIAASSNLKKFYEERQERLPEGYLVVTPFSSMTTGIAPLPIERYQLAIDFLFFHTDVPITGNCLNQLTVLPTAYDMTSKPKVYRVNPSATKFNACLKQRAQSRSRADWIFNGDVQVLPATYNHEVNNAVSATIRICPENNRCALITSSFYPHPLIFELSISNLPIFKNISHESIIEIVPLLLFTQQGSSNSDKPQYYAYNEAASEGSQLFFDIFPYATNLYEIRLKSPPIEPTVQRTLREHVYTRLELALNVNSISVLANNELMIKILDMFDDENKDPEALEKIIAMLPLRNAQQEIIFRNALFFATRHIRSNRDLIKLSEKEDEVIQKREKIAMRALKCAQASKMVTPSQFAQKVLDSNNLGPIFFVTPELGPFSRVGGISTMVWELAKELVSIGVDVSVISPYYNIGPKGETNYLTKWDIKFQRTIDVYAPDKFEVGVHYGVVDGVKLWFLHNYTFFSTPYPTGSTSYKLQYLIMMAKGALELLCQERIIPSLVITNDWPTGLVAAYARQTFGSVFEGTQFLHIFHNLGIGYAGKIWPSDQNTGALHYLHNLPDELIVDNFDHSFDPSLSALHCTDQWATVSKKYREELLEGSPYNYFLRQFPKPFAFSNGIRFQERLKALENLKMNHTEAKAFIQKKYFGSSDPSKCLFVFVGRIVEQKGVHLITDTFEELNREFNGRLQFIVGGQAAPDDRSYGQPVCGRMWDLKNRYPESFWADPSAFFTDGLACCHGADYFLIPSMFEPSGIVQQEAFASGTPCIAFRTGGLADTVFEFDREKRTGNGVVFWAHRHRDFIMAVERAIALFNEPDLYNTMRKNAFESVLSTETVARAWAREFARLFQKIYDDPVSN